MTATGKPVLLDKMNAELGARVVELIIEDNERAKKRAEERAKKKQRAAEKRRKRR